MSEAVKPRTEKQKRDDLAKLEDIAKQADAIGERYDYHSSQSIEMDKGEIVALGFIATVVVGFVGLVAWADWKRQKEEKVAWEKREEKRKKDREEHEAWAESERMKGNIVCVLRSGDYLSISADAYKDATIKPKTKL